MFPFFFFNDTATTEIYTLSLHDALPISPVAAALVLALLARTGRRVSEWVAAAPRYAIVKAKLARGTRNAARGLDDRSEEHTSELQSLAYLVCRIIRSEEHTSELQSLAYL